MTDLLNFITWTPLNRIWRAKYITRSMILWLLLSICSFLITFIWALFHSALFVRIVYLLLLLLWILAIYLLVYINNKRFHDRWISWWRQLLLLVPVVNIWVALYLWFAPWDEWENVYWAPSETKKWEVILAWIVPILVSIFMAWTLFFAILPRMDAAQWNSRDASRKADLHDIQTAIITVQTVTWRWPGMDAAKKWISISDIENELMQSWISVVPRDPILTSKVTWLWSAEAEWDYLFLVSKRGRVNNAWFTLMAKTDSEIWSNWIVCENKSWLENWYITNNTDLKDIKTCSYVIKWTSCSASDCTYTSKDQLRYILLY